jgi:hypothetical protein
VAAARDDDKLAQRQALLQVLVQHGGGVERAVGHARRKRHDVLGRRERVEAAGVPRDGRAAGELGADGAAKGEQVGKGDARPLGLERVCRRDGRLFCVFFSCLGGGVY